MGALMRGGPRLRPARRSWSNVRDRYLLVGTMERLDEFVQVLELKVPQVFSNAAEAWKANKKPVMVRNAHATRVFRELLRATSTPCLCWFHSFQR